MILSLTVSYLNLAWKKLRQVKERENASGSPHVDTFIERQAVEYLWSSVRGCLQHHPWSESGVQ